MLYALPPVDRSVNFEINVPLCRNVRYFEAFWGKPYYSSKQNQHEEFKKKLEVEEVK
jgi:hypothetical protein